MSSDDDDPWGFLAKPAKEGSAQSPPEPPEPQPTAIPKRQRGELRASITTVSLKRRAFPMALSLALVSLAGVLTEVVAASQVLTTSGPRAMLVVYPLSGVILALTGLAIYRFIDGKQRLAMIRSVALGYAVAFVAALLVHTAAPAIGGGLAWILADQLNFLLPLLVWSLAGDEFNVAEGRKIFGWMVVWTFTGQVVGLIFSIAGVPAMQSVGLALISLLLVGPLVTAFVGWWLPRAMRDSAAAQGLARQQTVRESVRSAWDFVSGIPVWRQFLLASVLTFIAGMVMYVGFMAGFETAVGDDAGRLQMLLGGVGLVSFLLCWLIQVSAAERLLERLGIPGVLLILPTAVVVGSLITLAGVLMQSLLLLAIGFSMWLIPRWGVDENARRAALALVPDERRARVSLLVDMGPVAAGLIASAPLAAVGLLSADLWLVPVVALVVALIALRPSVKVRQGWEDSLLNWRLRRRKRGRAATLDRMLDDND